MAGKLRTDEAHRVVPVCIVYKEADEGRTYLITQRALDRKIFPGKWGGPGGGLKRSDYAKTEPTLYDGWHNPLDAAIRREIRQETHIEVGALTYVGNFSHITDDDVAVLGIRFCAPYKSGIVKLNRELIAYAWESASDIAHYDCMGGFAESIAEVESMLNKRELWRAAP